MVLGLGPPPLPPFSPGERDFGFRSLELLPQEGDNQGLQFYGLGPSSPGERDLGFSVSGLVPSSPRKGIFRVLGLGFRADV